MGNFDLIHDGGGQAYIRDNLPGLLGDDPTDRMRLLDGEFALAVWDTDTHRLTLVRDRAGTRPIFYTYETGRWFAFASLPGALIDAGLVAPDLDQHVLAQWSQSFDRHGDQTHFRGIKRVMPAHCLTFAAGSVTQRRYWSLQDVPRLPARTDYRAVTTELRRQIERAVHRRLPERGPAFSHMSGGLDSAPLAVIGAKALAARGDRLSGYSFLPLPDHENDPDLPIVTEWPAIKALCARNPNIDLVPVFSNAMPIVARHYFSRDFPHTNHDGFYYHQALSHAADAGASTVISGFGGDEAASYDGRAVAGELMRRLRFWSVYRSMPKRARNLYGLASLALAFAKAHPELAPLRWLAAQRSRAARDRAVVQRFLRPEFRSETPNPPRAPDCREDMHQMFSGGRLGMICEELTWRAARYGLAYTLPLMDREVVEFAASIPAEIHQAGPMRRSVYRDAMTDILPDVIRHRPEKLIANPRYLYELSGHKPALRKEITAMRGTEAEAVFDLQALMQGVEEIQELKAFAGDVRRATARDRQYGPAGMQVLWPLHLACYMAAHGRARPG
ncbi:MAG: asparagine synthase-related protein [Pseudomonadota bacterium]